MASITMDNPLHPGGVPQLSPSPQAQLNKNTCDMQECISEMKQEFEDHHIPITDDSQTLQRFCAKFEFLLQFGMKSKSSLLGGKKDYWNYISDCLSANKGSSDGIKFVKSISDLKTSLGRGRAFIRFCLMHQRLADTIQQCVYNSKVTSDWYLPKSVWLQSSLTSTIITSLYDLNDLQFDLSPRGYDLDTAWPTFARKSFGAATTLRSWAPPTRSSSVSSLSSIPNTSLDYSGTFPSPSFNSSAISEAEVELVREELNEAENEKIRLQTKLEIGDAQKGTMEQEIAELKSKLEQLQKEKNDYQIECDKLKNELKLKEETWAQRQEFYNGKIDEATKAVRNMKDKLDRQNALVSSSTAAVANFDMIEAKGQLTVLQRKNAALQIELKAVEMELKSKTMIEEQKSRLIGLLDRKLAQVNKRNNELAEKIDKLKAEGDKPAGEGAEGKDVVGQEKVNDLQTKVQDLTERLEYSETVNSQLKHSNAELRKMLADLEGKGVKLMDLAKEKIKKYSEENKQLKSDTEGLSKQLTQGDEQVKEVKNLLMAAEKEKDHIVQQKKDLEVKLDTLAESIVNKEETNIEIMNEVLKIRESMAQTEEERINKEYKEKMEKLEKENKELAESLQKSKEEFDKISTEKTILDQQMKSLKAVLNPTAVVDSKPLDATDGAKKEDVEGHEIQAMVMEMLKERQQFQTELRTSEARNSELRCQAETDRFTINDQSEELMSAQLQLAELKTFISQSEISNADTDNKVEDLQEVLKTKEKEYQAKDEETKRKEKQLVELENKNADIETLLTEKDDQIKELKKRLQSTNDDFSQAVQSSEALVIEKEEIEKENGDLLERIKEIQEECSVVGSNLKSIEAERNSLEQDKKGLNENIDSLEKEKEKLNVQLKELQDSFGQSVKEKLVTLNEKLQDERNEKEKVEKELENIKRQFNETETHLKDILEKKDEEERKQQEIATKLKDKVEEMEKIVVERNEEIERGKTEMFELSSKVMTLTSSEENLKSECSNLSDKFAEGCSRLREVLGNLKTSEETVKNLQEELEGLRNEKQNTEVQIQNFTIEIGKLQEKMEDKEKEMNELNGKLTARQQDVERMNKDLEEKEDRKKTLEMELGEIKEKNSELQQNLSVLEREKSLVSENLNKSQCEMQASLETSTQEVTELQGKLEKITSLKTDVETELNQSNKMRDDLEVELEEVRNELETLKTATENMKSQLFEKEQEVEKSRSEVEVVRSEVKRSQKDAEVAKSSLEQELSALRFQLSSEQMQYQDMLKGYKSQQSGVTEMSQKLEHQTSVIESLEQELNQLKQERQIERQRQQEEASQRWAWLSKEVLWKRLEEYKQNYAEKNESCTLLNTQLKKTAVMLNEERKLVLKYKNEVQDMTKNKDEQLQKLEAELALTQHDNQEMMKHLVKLCKDKDQLWQKTDKLQYIQKLMASGKWMDDSDVKRCMNCDAEFSWMLRKHHCRTCGRIFCYSCCNNWTMTPHSSKKARVCNDCVMAQSLTEDKNETDEQTEGAEDEEKQSDDGEKVAERRDAEKMENDVKKDEAAVLETNSDPELKVQPPESKPHIPGITDIPTPPPSRANIPAAGAIPTNPYEYNVNDEEKEHKMFYVGSVESTEIQLSGDEGPMEDVPLEEEKKGREGMEEAFDLITEEEVAQSMHESMIEPSLHDPNLMSSPTLTVDQIASGDIPQDPNLWIKAGKNYAVPVNMDSPGVVLSWEFSTEPKGIHFSVNYRENMYVDTTQVEELIPRTACNSHKQAVQGELFARKAGLYTLLFDNTTSRFTSKRLEYKLQVRKPELADSSPTKHLH